MLPPIILISFALAFLLWIPVGIRYLGLFGGALCVLLCGACLGYDLFHVSVITSDRALLGGLVLMYALQRNFHGLAARKLRQSDVLLLAFFAAIGGITFASDWKWNGMMPMSVFLFFYCLPLVMYWIVSRCTITEAAFKGMLIFFVVFGCYLTVIALLEVLGLHGLILPRYIVDSPTIEFLGRARGPFLNPVGNGMYMTMSAISCILLWPYVHKLHRPLLIGLTGFLCVGAICTLTRSVWIGTMGAILTMGVLAAPKQHRLRVILATGIIGATMLAAVGGSLLSFKRDKHLSASEAAESAKLRPILAAFAYEMFWDRPFTGVGLSQYQRYNQDFLTDRSFDLPMVKAKDYVQHNVFLSLLVETGLIGLTLFCLTLVIWGFGGWKLWHATELPLWQRQAGMICLAMLAAYFPNGMFHEMSLVPMQNMLLFFVAGLSRNFLDGTAGATSPAFARRASDQIEMRRATDGYLPA